MAKNLTPRERKRASDRAYYEATKERKLARQRERYLKDPEFRERQRQYVRQWRSEHR